MGLSIIVFAEKSKAKEKKVATNKIEETTTSSKQEVKEVLPGKIDDWQLVLVNEDHEITDEPSKLTALPNGYLVDERIYDAYQELSDSAEEAGFTLAVISAYRSIEAQQEVMETDITGYENQGFSTEEAKEKTMEYVTKPGHSEHHTGLALDVLDTDWYNQGKSLEEEFGETKAGQWLAQNAYKHGFVIRYEKGKEAITDINYEPWHIRYVGKENAKYMYEHQLVLEEYIEQLKK